nr:zinc knuckle CX2CX4HX4C [Tanacetum cinerariifolium]
YGGLSEADHCQTPQYTVNHPVFNAHNDLLNTQNKLIEQVTSVCEMFGQFIQKKHEEKQAANARYWKIPAYCDDDDDYNFAITPNEPVDSLSMGDEHLDTVPAIELDEFIKSSVENVVPNPSEAEGENGYDVPACFTTFLNILFNANYEFDSSDDQSLYDEDIDSLLDEFAGELTLLKSIPPVIDETDCDPKEDIRLIDRLLYDNSSPHHSEEFVSENSNADIESFSPSPILVEDSDSLMEEIDLSFTPDDPMPSGIEEDDYDSEMDILIHEKLLDNYSLSLPEIESYQFDIPSEGTATRVNLEEQHDIMKNSKGAFEGLQCETPTRARSNPSYGFGDYAIACDGAVIEADASKDSPGDSIVQAIDINTKSTSHARAAGASAKELPKVNSNFCPLVADLVFDGVNICIPCKVIEKVNSEVDLVDVFTVGIPSLKGEGFTKETICVKYEWTSPKYDIFKIFGHVHDHFHIKVVSSPIVTNSNVVTPTVETNDGFQMVGKNRKRKVKSKSTNGALNDEEEDVENVYDESANLFQNTNTGESSSFTAAAGFGKGFQKRVLVFKVSEIGFWKIELSVIQGFCNPGFHNKGFRNSRSSHRILNGIRNDIYSIMDACPNANETWIGIEHLQQGESINIQDVRTKLFWEFGKFTSRDGESIESYYTRFYKMMNEMVRNNLKVDNIKSSHRILNGIRNDIYSIMDACPNANETWIGIERLQQGESINIQDVRTKLFWEFGTRNDRNIRQLGNQGTVAVAGNRETIGT